MGSVALTVISMTIGFFFVFVGTLKLTPSINNDIYKEMRRGFIRSAKVFPFVKQSGWKPNPHTYRKVVGSLEVICGVILIIVPGPLKEGANLVLLAAMLNDLYTHYALHEGLDRMTPAIIFALLLICRFIIHCQIQARENKSIIEINEEHMEKARGRGKVDGEKKDS